MEKNTKIRTILVVEDEMPLQNAIVQKLKISDFNAIGVRSVSEALEKLEKDLSIKAIWLDHYLMGQESGLDLVKKLKSKEGRLHDIPIFVVSNTASNDKVKEYVVTGITEYFVKATNRLDQIIDDIKKTLK